MTDPMIRCLAVHKSYGGVGVLHGVTLHADPGEIVGLVGANGAGKTTLVDIIAGQQRADSGAILLGASELTGAPSARALQGLARTFQLPQVAHDLSLRDNVAVGLAARRLISVAHVLRAAWRGIITATTPEQEEIEAVCDRVALADIDRAASEVTFGELRLVEVARALIQHPKLIILDEPFSGVGDSGVKGIMAALAAIKTQGAAVLLIDHNVDLLTDIVDRMALLAQGEIVVDGDVATCVSSERFRSTYIGAV